MKSVLISIQPKWCELIAKGDKMIEVRKTKPKIDTPFKCYIYETQSLYKGSGGCLFNGIGKVIGEFWCYKITKFNPTMDLKQLTSIDFQMCEKSCVNMADLYKYANGKMLYGWHISNLIIYENPKDLSEFSVIDDKAIKECEHRERVYQNPDYVNGAWLFGGYVCNKGEIDWCCDCKRKPLARPPQSWCYVED